MLQKGRNILKKKKIINLNPWFYFSRNQLKKVQGTEN